MLCRPYKLAKYIGLFLGGFTNIFSDFPENYLFLNRLFLKKFSHES